MSRPSCLVINIFVVGLALNSLALTFSLTVGAVSSRWNNPGWFDWNPFTLADASNKIYFLNRQIALRVYQLGMTTMNFLSATIVLRYLSIRMNKEIPVRLC